MSVKPPFTEVEVRRAASGFYKGHSLEIALLSKAIMVGLVLWALVFPANANGVLGSLNWRLLEGFNSFYVIIVGLFFFFLLVVAVLPQTGKRIMGRPGEGTEFSNFSWFSMMFGAGLGVGLMVFATAEPLGLWGSNPVVLSGSVEPNSRKRFAVRLSLYLSALRIPRLGNLCRNRSFVGLLRVHARYAFDHPLRFDTAFRQADEWAHRSYCRRSWRCRDHSGCLSHHRLWRITVHRRSLCHNRNAVDDGHVRRGTSARHCWADCRSGIVIMGLSIISAVSGVGRGVKYLSNLNLVLSLILLMTFVIFGSFLFAMTTYATAMVDYIAELPVAQLCRIQPASCHRLCSGTAS